MGSIQPATALFTIWALLGLPVHLGAQDTPATMFEGTWCGVADIHPDAGLPVTVQIKTRGDADSLRVALSLPESRLVDLAIPSPYSDSAAATIRDGVLTLDFPPDIGLGIIGNLGIPRDAEHIRFSGTVARDEDRPVLRGRIGITTYESPIVLSSEPCASPFREPPVAFPSAGDSLRIAGKLVLPDGPGPHPAAVFVTGSDPDTREVWQFEARALAARGVASLLYDKRGVGQSIGASHDLASWDDLAGDVAGAVRYLRSRSDLIDPSRIGLIGQSQGTWIITKVAASDPEIRFLVTISGGGVSAAEQETYRTGALMRVDGFSDSEIERATAFQREKFAVARTGVGWERLDSTMQQLRADSVPWFPGYGTGAAAQSLAVLRLYGVLQFNYDPTRDLEQITSPVLVLMGERDVVFPPAVVIERTRAALARGGNDAVTAVVLPEEGHGHTVVQTSRGRPFRRAISEEFVRTLTEWVVGQVDH
ncbi:MAG TPA: alpha/beta hydrolase [Gemmatimonadota bacterium]|nr:alpha/beta hydrolase [Gemmatimonadota bacterium]